MNVIEPTKKVNLVRAGSIEQEKAFKDRRGAYFIVLDIRRIYFECSVRDSVNITYEPTWVFNVQTNALAIFDVDAMVEPVELEVHVREKV